MSRTQTESAGPMMSPLRVGLHTIIFEADTRAGKLFDVLLLITITLSILVVMLDSVKAIEKEYHVQLRAAEWVFTILFTVEYALRFVCVKRPWRYAFSFFGLVDLLAILPTFISLVLPTELYSLLVIRSLRLLRVFRIFKLARFLTEATALRQAMWASRAKITVFIVTVMTVVIIMGSAMYLIEGEKSGFTSIPQSMYWAIVTMTTVGYGDIAPVTMAGKAIAAAIMIMGYSMIIIPTGIISAEIIQTSSRSVTTQSCPSCMAEDHSPDAAYCRLCGSKL